MGWCCCCPGFGGEDEYTGCWKFHLIIISAKDLPNVRNVFKTRAYAKIYVGSDGEMTEHRTDSDNNNRLNPAWNHSIAYETTDSGVLYNSMTVTIKLYTKRSLGRDSLFRYTRGGVLLAVLIPGWISCCVFGLFGVSCRFCLEFVLGGVCLSFGVCSGSLSSILARFARQ